MNWRTVVPALLWIPAAYATWSFLGNYWAPDACLDVQHGSFDFQAWTCSLNESKPYVETAIFLVPGFLPAVLSLFGAVAGTALLRQANLRRAKQAS